MFAIAYSYEARDADDFERVYGPEGEWSAFFASGGGFVGTELLREVENPGRYLVVDRWESREAFERFAEEHRDEYVRRVEDTGVYFVHELRLGIYESVW